MSSQFPSEGQLLRNYAAVLTASLQQPRTVEEQDQDRLELQAVLHHLRKPK